MSGWWRNEEWRPRQAAVRGDFVSCPSVLVASPVEVSPTPLHHHLLKLHHLPSQRNFVSLLSSSLVYFCFYPLPTSAPRLGKTTHSLSHNSTPSSSQLSQGPRKSFSDSLGKVLPNSGSYFDITFRVLPGLPGISGKQDRQHRFKLGCTLGFQLCSTQRRKL